MLFNICHKLKSALLSQVKQVFFVTKKIIRLIFQYKNLNKKICFFSSDFSHGITHIHAVSPCFEGIPNGRGFLHPGIVQHDLRQSCNNHLFCQFLKSGNEDLAEKLRKLREKKFKLRQNCSNHIFNPSAFFFFLLTCDT